MLCPVCGNENIIKRYDIYFCIDCEELIDKDDIIFDVVDIIDSRFEYYEI